MNTGSRSKKVGARVKDMGFQTPKDTTEVILMPSGRGCPATNPSTISGESGGPEFFCGVSPLIITEKP